MENLKLSFVIEKIPSYAIAYKDDTKTMEIEILQDTLDCWLRYDYNRKPLNLSSKVQVGDKVEIVMLPYRQELYVNGELKDEEWPAGLRLFDKDDELMTNLSVCREGYTVPEKNDAIVQGTIDNAEGWKPGENVFVGDCMPHIQDGAYHVLYLRDRNHHHSKWALGGHQWDHISTKDFKTWDIHPMVLPIEDPAHGSFCTGSYYGEGGKHYLYYTFRNLKGQPRPVVRSVSEDGYHYRFDETFEPVYLAERYNGLCARDPKIIKDEEGMYHMFLTTRLVQEKKGCVAHYISEDLDHWRDAGEPIYVAADNTDPECPDYFIYKGRYYFVYSLHANSYYLYSDRPFDGWKKPKDDYIPCGIVPKAALWEDKVVFTGFKRVLGDEYAGTMTFKTATADENGELIFE